MPFLYPLVAELPGRVLSMGRSQHMNTRRRDTYTLSVDVRSADINECHATYMMHIGSTYNRIRVLNNWRQRTASLKAQYGNFVIVGMIANPSP